MRSSDLIDKSRESNIDLAIFPIVKLICSVEIKRNGYFLAAVTF